MINKYEYKFSRFSEVKIIPTKTTNAGESTKNKILEAHKAEAKRATILALASA